MKKWWYVVGIVISIIIIMASPRFGRTLTGWNPVDANGFEGEYLTHLPYHYDGRVEDESYEYALKYTYDEEYYLTIAYPYRTSRDFTITYSNGETVFERVFMDRGSQGDDEGYTKRWYIGLAYNIIVQDCYGTFYFVFIKSILLVSFGIWMLLRVKPEHSRWGKAVMRVVGCGVIVFSVVHSLRII